MTDDLHTEALVCVSSGCLNVVYMWLVRVACYCVCVRAHACAFCMSQPLKICLFLFYNRFLSLCKAPGRAWRSRNCLQVVLQA